MKLLSNYFKKHIYNFSPRLAFFRSLAPHSTILDIGCGSGSNAFAIWAINSTATIYGLDLYEGHFAPQRIIYKQVNLDVDGLPYPDNYFDAIVCTHVIEHLQNPISLGSDIYRILKPTGSLYIEAPNWISMLIPSFGLARNQHNPFNFFDDPTHLRPWTKQSLYELVATASALSVMRLATVKNYRCLLFDPFIILYGIAFKKRSLVINSVWNLVGWSIFCVGIKD